MKYASVYGIAAGAIAIVLITATMTLGLHSLWLGYLVMLLGLSLIFVGTKRYRDVECGGVIRFGRAFALGLAIALVASVIYAIGWEIYLAVSGYDFMADYTAATLKSLRASGATQATIDAKAAEMHAMAESYRNPLKRLPMTFVEVFPPSLLVALVSAAVLRKPEVLPARG